MANTLWHELDDQDPLLADDRPQVNRRSRLAEEALPGLRADEHVDAPFQALDRDLDLLGHLRHLLQPVVADRPIDHPAEDDAAVGRGEQEALEVEERRLRFAFKDCTDAHQEGLLHADGPGPDLGLDTGEDLADLPCDDVTGLGTDDAPVEGVDAGEDGRGGIDDDDPVVGFTG